jgi:hypothetical protein
MIVCDINNKQHEVNSVAELDAVLVQRRHDGANAFWLAHDGKKYPHLALLVNGQLASVHYFPKDRDAGHIPVGNLAHLLDGEMTAFPISQYPADDVFVTNDAVVPVPVAIGVAYEFFQSDARPTGLAWQRL